MAKPVAGGIKKVTALKYHTKGKTVEYETPDDFFQRLNRIYRFNLDVCATPKNAKCQRYFTVQDDGLSKQWDGVCWMNPPYGRAIRAWMKKAYEESKTGTTVVCLVPSRTDAAWWHDYAMKGQVEFLRGRLKFGGSKNCAPFPCALVVFRGSISGTILPEELKK
jgi:phage N-6-adenine-methyltransferase